MFMGCLFDHAKLPASLGPVSLDPWNEAKGGGDGEPETVGHTSRTERVGRRRLPASELADMADLGQAFRDRGPRHLAA